MQLNLVQVKVFSLVRCLDLRFCEEFMNPECVVITMLLLLLSSDKPASIPADFY